MGEIKTYSGIMFDPLNPREELIRIGDIAHALSMLCRANGHFKSFYSVGQHCINCAKEAEGRGYSDRVVLACLLHDGAEAYVSDIIRPVKVLLENFDEIETRFQEAIYAHFGLGDLTEEERHEYIQMAFFNIEKLNDLTENILRLSKLENQSTMSLPVTYRLDEQIREAIVLLEPKWSAKNIALDLDLPKTYYTGQ